jgi:hypothetical protein
MKHNNLRIENPVCANTRIAATQVMSKESSLKCLYCECTSSDKEERKRHLKEEHYARMVEIARKSTQTIDWAAGYRASFFTKDNPES